MCCWINEKKLPKIRAKVAKPTFDICLSSSFEITRQSSLREAEQSAIESHEKARWTAEICIA